MDERLYTLRLTAADLFTIRFELDLLAHQHEHCAVTTDNLMAHGFRTPRDSAYWLEQAANCRRVVAKAQAAMDAGPSMEAK